MISAIKERIKERYERDHREYRKAIGPEDLPIDYEAITPEWLTHFLCKDHPDAKVVSYSLSEKDNGSTNRRRIFVKYNDAGIAANLPKSVFCKSSCELTNRISLGLSGAALGEVTFYNKIRPLLNIEAPVPYFAKFDPDSCNSMIVLRDDSERVIFGDDSMVINRAQAESMVRLMAVYHGYMHERKELLSGEFGLPTWVKSFHGNIQNLQLEEYTNKGFLAAEEVVPPRLFVRYPEIWPATIKSVDVHDVMPKTMIHSDTHLKNWYLTPGDGMGLMDWQLACIGHGSRDYAYAIAVALTVENRRAWERDLIQLYIDELAANGGHKMTFDEAMLFYRQQLFTALAWWTITLRPSPVLPQDMQPAETALEFIKRITTAMDDLDALDSFG
jgi:hypothetical protein